MFRWGFDTTEEIAKEFSNNGWDYRESRYQYEAEDFAKVMADLEGATIHVAWYGTSPYAGQAFVLFEKDGKLYENYGSHCSCMGLEDQWSPDETSWEALKLRLLSNDYQLPSNYYDGGVEARAALKAAVEAHDLTIN